MVAILLTDKKKNLPNQSTPSNKTEVAAQFTPTQPTQPAQQPQPAPPAPTPTPEPQPKGSVSPQFPVNVDGKNFIVDQRTAELIMQRQQGIQALTDYYNTQSQNKQKMQNQDLLKQAQQDLTNQRNAQQQQLATQFIDNTPRGNAFDRAANAGVSFLQQIAVDPISNALGVPAKDLSADTIKQKGILGTIAKIPAAAIGYMTTTGIGGIDISKTLGLGKDIPNIEADLRDIESNQEKVLREVRVTGNYQGGLEALKTLRDAAMSRSDELVVALEQSPSDIRAGKTVGDEIYRRLNSLDSVSAIIQYTQLTGDTSQLDAYLLSANANNDTGQ